MATTSFATGDVQAVKLWSTKLFYDSISDETLVGQMIGDGSIVKLEDTTKKPGDQVKFHLLARQSGKGLRGHASATGNEAALTHYQETVNIDQLRYPIQVPFGDTISDQRVTFDLSDDAYTVAKNWATERLAVSALYQGTGYNPTTITYDGETYSGDDRLNIQGLQAPATPSRFIRPNSLTTDEGVNGDSTATFKLSLIDEAEKNAVTTRPYIEPLTKAPGGIKYRCYVHTSQWYQAIQDTTGPIQFRDIYLSQIQAGKGEGAIRQSIVYSQTEIIPTDKIPNGVHSSTSAAQTNVRRALFVGKEAVACAFGRGYDGAPGFKFKQDDVDIQEWKRIAVCMIYGMAHVQYNSISRGAIVIPTYVA